MIDTNDGTNNKIVHTQVTTPFLIGHRGARACAPENTLEGIKYAHQMGIRWVEFDVKLTSDDQLILLHDDDLDRTTNGNGLALNYTLAQLQKFNANAGFKQSAKIPTLIEIISFLKSHKMGANIEIKPNINQNYITGKAVALLLNKKWLNKENTSKLPIPVISSFNFECLAGFNDYYQGSVEIALLYDQKLPNDFLVDVKRYRAGAIHMNKDYIDKILVDKVKEKGLALRAYTVNKDKKALKFKEWGVDAIFTDFPDLLT